MIIQNIVKKYYTHRIEDISVRLLYFLNTIDTYFLVAGITAAVLFSVLFGFTIPVVLFIAITGAAYIIFKVADFYPLFVVCSPVYLFFLMYKSPVSLPLAGMLLLLNFIVFIVVQFIFMSIPESIVARDITIGFRKIWNSALTIAPTTVSMSMSVFFSYTFSLMLITQPDPRSLRGFLFWILIGASAVVAGWFKPKSFQSVFYQPAIGKKLCHKVIVLNIDGCRLDRFYEAQLPFLSGLEKQSSYFPRGMYTVYRALTNPAFASILTGAVPEVHGIRSNNLGQKIKVEALPDIVHTKLYGSMHVQHFSKKSWHTNIVSLPRHSEYKADDIMFTMLTRDLLKDDGTRLFIADISETDFLGHAYGSESSQYLEALKRADKRIEDFFHWLEEKNLLNDTVIIICSDHGIVRIDHSYLLFDAEKYVPFIITGKNIKKNNKLMFEASIMDIAPTISYALGIGYPSSSKARVIEEVFEKVS